MKPIHRDIVTCLTVAAIVGAAAWTYEWYGNRPRFAIEQDHLVFAALPTGQEQKAVFRIHNLTGNVMRIVGAESG